MRPHALFEFLNLSKLQLKILSSSSSTAVPIVTLDFEQLQAPFELWSLIYDALFVTVNIFFIITEHNTTATTC